jgi:cyclase
MFRPRIIPVLLLKNNGLVKSYKFKDHRYIGDPINAVRIFNDQKADELVFLDTDATSEGRTIKPDLVQKIGDECNMPFAVGGGIKTIAEIRQILNAGAEKVIINTKASRNPEFIRQASTEFGSSTIVVSIDVISRRYRRDSTCILSGKKSTGFDPVEFSLLMQEMGAGEVLIQSIQQDGTMEGYNLELVKKISNVLSIPLIACSGAGNLSHLAAGYYEADASAMAAGSLFVYHGPRKAVLINYPDSEELKKLFSREK